MTQLSGRPPLNCPRGNGNPTASIFFIKDSPSFDECRKQQYGADSAGNELARMCHEAGIIFTETFISAVSREYQPYMKQDFYFTDKKSRPANLVHFADDYYTTPNYVSGASLLAREIEAVNPAILVPIGPIALKLVSGEDGGLSTWRGSVGWSSRFNRKYLATLDPSLVMKRYDWRYHSVRDLQRVAHEARTRELKLPEYRFEIAPSFGAVMSRLQRLIDYADGRRNDF